MLKSSKKVTVEVIDRTKENKNNMSNSIKINEANRNKISLMINDILSKEFPHLKNNSLLKDLVLYSLAEKMSTVQTMENVLSYIKGSNAKVVQDVSFKNGEIRIKCLT